MTRNTILLGVVLLAGAVAAATQYTRILNLQVAGRSLLGTTTETGNVITKALGGSASLDFAAAASRCEDLPADAGITVVGASVGDPCFVGVPASVVTADAGAESQFSCYVSEANAVRVRFCTNSYENPAAETYYVRVISSQ